MVKKISDISLTRQNYEELESMVSRYHSVKENYKQKKYKLQNFSEYESKNTFSFFKSKNEQSPLKYNEELQNLEKEVKSLKSQKDDLYFQIKNIVKRMIIENGEYDDLYNEYLGNMSSNEEVRSISKPYIDLINKKVRIDAFFYKLERIIEGNMVIKDSELEEIKNKYKEIMTFLKEVYDYMNDNVKKDKDVNLDNININDEINLNDSYAILSIISILYSQIINPVYNSYKPTYKEYRKKVQYIREYDAKINEITNNLLKSKK